jgi:hypothetical protein
MTTGIVESGRRVAIGRGRTAGVSFGIGTAVGSATAVGSGTTFGSGRALAVGRTSGGIVIAGSGSGDAIGNGPSVAAASGVRGEAVHATDAISAKRTSVRTVPYFSPPAEASKSPASGGSAQRKQLVVAVHSASTGLTGLRASP